MKKLIIDKIWILNKKYSFEFGKNKKSLNYFLLHLDDNEVLELYNTLIRYDEQTEYKKYLLKEVK